MKNLLKNYVVYFIIILMLAFFVQQYVSQGVEVQKADINTLINQINAEEVREIIVEPEKFVVTLKNDTKQEVRKEIGVSYSELFNNYGIEPQKYSQEKIEKLEIKDASGFGYWMLNLLPYLFPLLIIGFLIYFMMKQVQNANSKTMMFGQSGARELKSPKEKITFDNVAGVKEAKEELHEIVDFLKNPKKFQALGARTPKGVLLVGAPGTGKTLLARAVAGEADVPFFHISGSEFVEMFVGVGASRVRDLFKKAKKNAPAIVFIDEIDAVGRQRGAGLGGSHDEREQTLNQILVEMDGFEPNTTLIVIAATNRPDVLDPALLRPGRFDRRVILDGPDINDREEILKVHAHKKPLAKNVSLRTLAERTPGFTGADLANLLNEAAILAARKNKKIIEEEDLFESVEKVLLGPERKSHILSNKEKRITAYHEAGHALVAHLLPNTDPVHKISIISRGRVAGYTLKLPSEDKHLNTKVEFIEEIAVLLSGYITEKIVFKDVTTGASNDLKEATKLAKKIITQYGMSDSLGARTFGEKEEMVFLGKEIHERRDYSEKVAESIDKEISKVIKNAMNTAQKILIENKDKLDLIAKELLKKETLERKQFESLFK